MTTINTTSKGMRITGRIITILLILFLLFDAIGKIAENHYSMEGSVALGWPAESVRTIGIVLLLSTILYAIPRTAILGAILVTAYLGGATAIMVRVHMPLYFCVIFGILVWAGLFLQDARLREMIPFKK
ncbi:DoxX family protein [Chitinophaga sp. Mgbs1]|uniref:DoxX family protein n=1 Tax=Chitinophaga solisilvae TaxID=1233460 RepID=A0A433WH46_9BACT|nr:DoxX family protein [Chitinophaga solisilvae]